jgi:hypothetical protein
MSSATNLVSPFGYTSELGFTGIYTCNTYYCLEEGNVKELPFSLKGNLAIKTPFFCVDQWLQSGFEGKIANIVFFVNILGEIEIAAWKWQGDKNWKRIKFLLFPELKVKVLDKENPSYWENNEFYHYQYTGNDMNITGRNKMTFEYFLKDYYPEAYNWAISL